MTITKILAQKGKWKVNLDKSLDYITHLLEKQYPKNSEIYLSQKEIWKKSLDYQLGKNTYFVFENNIDFWEFYNENDWLKKLYFKVEEQEKSIKLYINKLFTNYILKFDVLEITKNTLVFYVSEDDSYDDFSHHQLYIFCEFL